MDWKEWIAFCSCMVTILGSPFVFALYLGHKMDALATKMNDLNCEVLVMKKKKKEKK